MGFTANRAIDVAKFKKQNEREFNKGNSRYDQFANTNFALNYMFMMQSGFEDKNKPLFLLRGVMPFYEFESFQHRHSNSVQNFPLSHQVAALELEFYETEDLRVWNWFDGWASRVMNTDGTYQLPSKFKRRLVMFGLDRRGQKIQGFRYNGCWPIRISEFQPSSEESDVVKYTVTLSVDSVVRLKRESEEQFLSLDDDASAISTLDDSIVQAYVGDYNASWAEAKVNASKSTSKSKASRYIRQALNVGTIITGQVTAVPSSVPRLPF